MPRRRKPITIELERGADGTWHEAGSSHTRASVGDVLLGSGEFDPSVGVYRDLFTGEVYGPGHLQGAPPAPSRNDGKAPSRPSHRFKRLIPLSLPPGAYNAARAGVGLARRAVVGSERVIEGGLGIGSELLNLHSVRPPVPGSIGKWVGKGTKRDPYRWVGVPERALGYALLGLIAVWGAEVIEADVSQWWSNSILNVQQDLSKLDASVLSALGYAPAASSSGALVTGVRQHATFWTWIMQQIMVQGGDLAAGVSAINGLSTGLMVGPSGTGGLGSSPPGGTQIPNQPPNTDGTCNAGYTLMSLVAPSGNNGPPYIVESCVSNANVASYLSTGWTLGPPGSGGGSGPGGGGHGPPGGGGTQLPQSGPPGPGNTCSTGYTRVYQVVSGYTSYLCVLNSALSTFVGAGWIVG